MAQLKMYWLPGTEIAEFALPEGYSISNYKDEADKVEWFECCCNGSLVDENAKPADSFYSRIGSNPNIDPFEDVFFIDFEGKHVGTVTAYVDKNGNYGDMHMVGIKTAYRGRGLAKHLSEITLKHLSTKGIKYIVLTTDEFRKAAVASYLHAGFHPVEYDEGMEARWQAIIDEYGIDSIDMVNEDCSFYKTLIRNK